MRNLFYILLLFVLIVLAACGDSKTSGEDEDTKVEDTAINEPQEDEEHDTENESQKEEDEETVDQPEEEQVVAEYKVNENWFIKPINNANENIVLLTIDDAPDNHALDMAETLKQLEANAIFFVNGHFLETPEEKAIIKEIYEMGFLIGNHTYSHANLQKLTKEEQEEEILKVSDMVEEIIGERPRFFRAPHGANTDFSKQLAEEEGMTVMNWVYGYDWELEYQSKEAITDIMLNNPYLNNGANLLMHDREWTAAALHDIVTGLRDKAYEMVDPHLIE